VLKSKFQFLIAVICGILIVSGCNKKPESIGLNLVEHNKLPVYEATFSVSAYSVIDDSVVTDETSINLLGSMYTENFGLTVASFYSHLRLSALSPDFGNNPQVDSAFLTLVYSGYYGNISTPHTIRIYEVEEDFYKDSTYYSTDQFNFGNSEIGNLTFVPYPEDSVSINDSTKVSAQIKIPLTSLFVNKIFSPADDTVLSSNENFINYFKGIYITADSMASPGDGSILYFNLLSSRSKVTIYYNDTSSFDLVFNSNSGRVGHFYHNYAKSVNQNFKDQILNNDTIKGASNLYLQGLAGIKTSIKIPSISDWVNTNNYAINDAKLIIPVHEPADGLDPAGKLLLFKLNESGSAVFTEDQLEGDNYYGGSFNDSTNNYQFRLSFYLQDLLSGTPDYGLTLLISGKTTNANEVRIYGTEVDAIDSLKMSLRIVYTKVE
jgi:hypothetical protein